MPFAHRPSASVGNDIEPLNDRRRRVETTQFTDAQQKLKELAFARKAGLIASPVRLYHRESMHDLPIGRCATHVSHSKDELVEAPIGRFSRRVDDELGAVAFRCVQIVCVGRSSATCVGPPCKAVR